MPRLAESLAVVAPSLAPELVPNARAAALTAVAATLPPAHRAGFECRLGAGEDNVDLQLGVPATEGWPWRLAAFVENGDGLGAGWEHVGRLASRWGTPGDLVAQTVSELWLELDLAEVEDAQLSRPEPSVFAVLDPSGPERGLGGVPVVLETLVGRRQASASAGIVDRLARACPGSARVSHIGVMLGRPLLAMRVHVSDLPLGELGRYLDRIGLDGDAAAIEMAARMLLDHGDQLVLCLDLVGELTGRAGLECFFAQRQGVDPRWRPLLDGLIGLGLCTSEKADALMRWPGRTSPVDQALLWPEDLIIESIRHPPDVLGVIERRLSHVKLTCDPGAPLTAKAYFGYGHVWLHVRDPDSPPARRRQTRSAETADVAIGRAVHRLLETRNQAGWWRDFFDRARPADVDRRVTGYASDEWVTAFVATALASVPDEAAREAAREALLLLLARRHGAAGWGYHALLPADADTTTWVLRLAGALREPERGPLATGRGLIERLTAPDGGVATYAEDAAEPLSRFLQMEGSYAGWCASHTCVTAAAAALGVVPAMTSYLLAAQRDDGSWRGHWWDDDEYATARAVEALIGSQADSAAVAAAVAWSTSRIGADGSVRSQAHGGSSPFATALALKTIRVGGSSSNRAGWAAAAERAERWLLAHQLDDGSWEPSARLRVPPPWTLDPGAAPQLTLTYLDDEGLFTTAAVLAALVDQPSLR